MGYHYWNQFHLGLICGIIEHILLLSLHLFKDRTLCKRSTVSVTIFDNYFCLIGINIKAEFCRDPII